MSQDRLTHECKTERKEEVGLDGLTRAHWLNNCDTAFQCWVDIFSRREGKVSAANSIKMYHAIFNAFREYLAEREDSVLTISSEGIRDFLNNREGCDRKAPISGSSKCRQTEIIARALQPSTKMRYASLIYDLMEYLVERGFRQSNPAYVYVRSLKGLGTKSDIIFLSEPVEKLLQESLLHRRDVLTWTDRRRRVMLLFLLGTGVKSAQATAACVDDFHVTKRAIFFNVHKPNAAENSLSPQYQVRLAMFCYELVRGWLDERRAYLDAPDCPDRTGLRLAFPRAENGGRLSGVSLYFHVNECLREIGYEGRDMGPRVLRNTFMRRQMLNGVPDETLMHMCGLKTDQTLRRMRKSAS